MKQAHFRQLPRPTPALVKRAKELRRNMTVPERMLWNVLRRRPIHGLKFRRQTAIGHFIVDFYCPAVSLVIELDGMTHLGRAKADARRTKYLNGWGLRVLRYTNDQVVHDFEAVYWDVRRVVESFECFRGSTPSPGPSLKGGG